MSKCRRMYSIKWSEKQVDNMLNVKHRHAVFTILEELRNYFDKKREFLKKIAVCSIWSYITLL